MVVGIDHNVLPALFLPHVAYPDTDENHQQDERDENPVAYSESKHTASLPAKICQSIAGFFILGVLVKGIAKIIFGIAGHSHA